MSSDGGDSVRECEHGFAGVRSGGGGGPGWPLAEEVDSAALFESVHPARERAGGA